MSDGFRQFLGDVGRQLLEQATFSVVETHRFLASVLEIRRSRGLPQATHALKDSPLTLQDVIAREDYRNLMTAKIAVGDLAPDFELDRLDGAGRVRLGSLVAEQPVALIFGSYT